MEGVIKAQFFLILYPQLIYIYYQQTLPIGYIFVPAVEGSILIYPAKMKSLAVFCLFFAGSLAFYRSAICKGFCTKTQRCGSGYGKNIQIRIRPCTIVHIVVYTDWSDNLLGIITKYNKIFTYFLTIL